MYTYIYTYTHASLNTQAQKYNLLRPYNVTCMYMILELTTCGIG